MYLSLRSPERGLKSRETFTIKEGYASLRSPERGLKSLLPLDLTDQTMCRSVRRSVD